MLGIEPTTFVYGSFAAAQARSNHFRFALVASLENRTKDITPIKSAFYH